MDIISSTFTCFIHLIQNSWILQFIILYYAFLFVRSLPKNDLKGKAIFITGCDTGFGNDLTKRLDVCGARVFAGCLTEHGAKALDEETSENVKIVMIDISDEDSVRRASEEVSEEVDELYAVVNNAGVLLGYFFEMTPLHLVKKMLDVNTLGTMSVTKHFLPLVRGKGRIINTSSIVGRQTLQASAGYAASKFAIEGFSDTLRLELWLHNTKVVLVEPQGFRTPMTGGFSKHMRKLMAESSEEIRSAYPLELSFVENAKEENDPVSFSLEDPKIVVDTYITALRSKFPNTRYPVGKDASYFLRWVGLLPGHISDVLILSYSGTLYYYSAYIIPILKKVGIAKY